MHRYYYAAHNTYADLSQGNRGFLNSWWISRFPSKAERDAFVAAMDNQAAEAVTRGLAESIWRGNYESVGKPVPAGGLLRVFGH